MGVGAIGSHALIAEVIGQLAPLHGMGAYSVRPIGTTRTRQEPVCNMHVLGVEVMVSLLCYMRPHLSLFPCPLSLLR